MSQKPLAIPVAAFLCLVLSHTTYASTLSENEEQCYAVAMVAYDTVINSGLGLPLDEIIDSMVKNSTSLNTIDIYQDYLILVVMAAYNWKGSPHTYAVKTLYNCAVNHESVTHGN